MKTCQRSLPQSERTQNRFKEGCERRAEIMTDRKRSIIWSYCTLLTNDEATYDICQKQYYIVVITEI